MIAPKRRTDRIRVTRFDTEQAPVATATAPDTVAVEEPLEIRIELPPAGESGRDVHSVSVTMRTPGDDFELTAGFLFTEGILRERRQLVDLRYCLDVDVQEYNIVTARLRDRSDFDPASLNRNFYMTSSCGVCGKASLEAVEVRGCSPLAVGAWAVSAEAVAAAPDELRTRQQVFGRTGGIHAAGLFDPDGTLLSVREDVGRHNAVDKVVGEAFLGGRTPLDEHFLTVSGRSSFEIMQKALMAGVPMVVAVGAPSSLAVDLARRFDMTLAGFTRGGGFNVYHDPGRIVGAGES